MLVCSLVLALLNEFVPSGCRRVVVANATNETHEPHVVCPPANGTHPRGELLLYFGGSWSTPSCCGNFYTHAAKLGFHVISISYLDAPSLANVCGHEAPSCYETLRTDRLYNATTGGMPRLSSLLDELTRDNSTEGWAQFWAGSQQPHTIDGIAWYKIVTAGHSQGAGMALFVAKRFAVAGVAQLGGVVDVIHHGDQRLPAPWVLRPGVTPARKLYGLGNGRGKCCHDWNVNWPVLNMSGWLNVDSHPPRHGSGGHMLCSHLDDGLYGHYAILIDEAAYGPSWTYMLTRAAERADDRKPSLSMMKNREAEPTRGIAGVDETLAGGCACV